MSMNLSTPITAKFDGLDKLKNQYYVMRHGESLANLELKIVSHIDNGISGYGLSDKGREQVLLSVSECDLLDSNCLIISSDFRRAHETAKTVSHALNSKAEIELHPELRERKFGELELRSTKNYQRVWEDDQVDPWHTNFSVEPAAAVLERTLGVILNYEQSCGHRDILIVSHGDVLQILQTSFERKPVSQHRGIKHLQTSEIRHLTLMDR